MSIRRRIAVAVVGASMMGMALAGLLNPGFYLEFIGFSTADPGRVAYQLGEVRSVYGGLFAAIGVFTLLSGVDPVQSRSRLVVLGWCWLGLAGGRLLGAILDGDPGRRGWALLVFELAAGAIVLFDTPLRGTRGGRGSPVES